MSNQFHAENKWIANLRLYSPAKGSYVTKSFWSGDIESLEGSFPDEDTSGSSVEVGANASWIVKAIKRVNSVLEVANSLLSIVSGGVRNVSSYPRIVFKGSIAVYHILDRGEYDKLMSILSE